MYLSFGPGLIMPMSQYWHCTLVTNMILTAMLSTTLLILSMTFDRFCSIIRPHKAASFNRVKRAKITIVCAVFINIVFNTPHWFVTMNAGWLCLPFGNRLAMEKWYCQFYYWVSFAVQYAIPFVSLLSMIGVIIHTLGNRMRIVKIQSQELNQSQSTNSNTRSSEVQIYIILLLVTFAFLILSTLPTCFFL